MKIISIFILTSFVLLLRVIPGYAMDQPLATMNQMIENEKGYLYE